MEPTTHHTLRGLVREALLPSRTMIRAAESHLQKSTGSLQSALEQSDTAKETMQQLGQALHQLPKLTVPTTQPDTTIESYLDSLTKQQ
ncbi:hypothetical protein IWQ61_005653 [Dispira simplex]|nr:hypothetical protein IWQ61_005653 [Dispira simplex]